MNIMNTNKMLFLKQSGLLILFLLFSINAYTQRKEGFNWYFGAYVGMTWNTTQTINGLSDLPTPLPASAMTDQQEGVFGMSDSDGNLLFYSDGMTIWNKNHAIMSNGSGLTGHYSSAQSGIVIPYPGQSQKYIALTIGLNNTNNLSYSIIDMSANSGLGEITNEKNIQLTGAIGVLGESVAAVKHSNGNDYWIIAVGKGSEPNSALNVWKVTASGVQTSCYASYTLPVNTSATAGSNGYLRFSANGKYFAWPEQSTTNYLFFGTFDPSNGTFPIIKVMNAGYRGYGVEYSTTSEILYVADYTHHKKIHAYKFADLLVSPDPDNMSHRTVEKTEAANEISPLQLGPDGRIYGTVFYSTDMVVIDDINDYDNFTVHLVSGLLPTGSNYTARIGLPNYMAHYFAPVENTCSYFTDDIWYFGNGGGGIAFNNDGGGNKTAASASGESLVASAENSLSVSSPGCGSSLIFYSQHNQLYNALHQPMANGTFSGNTSVADGLAACYIGDNKYMVFSVTDCYNSGPMGLEYHIIDMNEDNGYGKKISTTTIEASGMSESVELIPVPNTSNEYWLIYNMYNANEIRVRKITGSTVSGIINTLPMAAQGITNALSFTFKANATYNMLGLAYPTAQRLALFDFDTNTGTISVNKIVTLPFNAGYGVEFSPNGKYVYCSTWTAPNQITQYDIKNNTFNATFAYGGSNGGGLKIGPDGKLYVRRVGQYMGVIENPNALLTVAGYTQNGFDLGNGINSTGLAFSTGLTPPAICPSGLNEAPVAVNDAYTVAVGLSVDVPIMLNDYDPNPGDSLSLVNVYFLNEADTNLVSISFNLGDSTIRVTPKDAAQEGDVITLAYTIRDDANPINLCSDAQLKITITNQADNVINSDCFIDPPGTLFTFTEMTRSTQANVHCLTTPVCGDIDNDGKIEIIVPQHTNTAHTSNLYIYEMDPVTNTLILQQTLTTPYFFAEGGSPYSIAKVDGNDYAAIFVATSNFPTNTAADKMQLIKYKFNGTQYVEDSRRQYSTTTNRQAPAPIITDFNGDSIPEVAVYDKVYNARTMTLLADGGYINDSSKGFGEGAHPNDTEPTVSSGSYMVAADVDGDGLPEFIGGNCVYKVSITNTTGTSGNSFTLWSQCDRTDIDGNPHEEAYDGATAVADFDGDGQLDIVITTRADKNASNVGNGALYIWNPRTGKVMNKNIINSFLPHATIARTASGPSVPFIGDIDNDGEPEICLSARSEMYAYDFDAATGKLILKWSKTTSDTSAATTMVLFDFNQDGTSELVYRDRTHLRIVSGIDGENLITPIECSSATGSECPIVVDVNGDGSAEILVTGGLSGADAWPGYLRIFSSNPVGAWAPARKVWNQFMYNSVNINEDLTVPAYQLNPATVFPGADGIYGTADDTRPYNGFLLQQTMLYNGTPLWLTPEGQIIGSPDFEYDTGKDSLTINLTVYNAGDAAFQPPFYITVYQDNVGNSLKHTYTHNETIFPGDTIVFTLPITDFYQDWYPFDHIVIQINDNGDGTNDQLVCDDSQRNHKTSNIIASNDRVLVYTDDVNRLIEVTLNDILPAGCTNPVVQVLSIPPYTGTTSVSGSDILYTPAAGATADTLRYRIHCGDASKADTANVYINIIKRPDNIIDADCYTEPPIGVWSFKEMYKSTEGVFEMSIPLVGDIDNDGNIEIVCAGTSIVTNNFSADTIKIFDAVGKRLKHKFPVERFHAGFGTIAMADVDRDGFAEIFVATAENATAGNQGYIYCYKHDGTFKWKSNQIYTTDVARRAFPYLNIADFNGDGIPEILANDRIFNAQNGQLLLDCGLVDGGLDYGTGAGHISYYGTQTQSKGSFTTTADMDNDNQLELVAGRNIYKININSLTNPALNTCTILRSVNATRTDLGDGYTAVADLNLDGYLDVVVVRFASPVVYMYAWDGKTGDLLNSNIISVSGGGYGGSIPFIGDLDGDGVPEIAFSTASKLNAYKYNQSSETIAAMSWSPLTTSDISASTTLTLFDFDQDKKMELVYRDMSNLRIIDGTTGTNKKTIACNSWTMNEYPVIADVDGDGHANIVVLGKPAAASHGNGYLYVFNCDLSVAGATPWAPARKVWNQWGYNTVNINEDLTVPVNQLNPATIFPGTDATLGSADDVRPYNGFLMQQTMLNLNGTPIWLTPDVYPDPSLVNSSIIGDSVSITIGMINQGDAAIGPPIYVSLYKETLSAANLFATDSANIQINPGDTGYVTIRIANIQPFLPMINMVVRVNDDGTDFTNFAYQPECDETNNVMTILNPAITLMMKKDATLHLTTPVPHNGSYSNPVSILHSEEVEYEITAVNANLVSGTTVVISDTLPPYLSYSSSTPVASVSTTTSSSPQRTVLCWTITGMASMASTSVKVFATPEMGCCASQPMFINRAWITTSDTINTPTNYTYHQGACVGVATFSAGLGGQIYNAGEQAVDYRATPRSGIVIVPDEGYRFAGWSHEEYISLRSEPVKAQSGIMHYDTLTVFGNVNLHANFDLETYPIRYHLNGANNASENPTNYTIQSGTISLNAPEKMGDEFIGWTGSNGEIPQQTVTIREGSTGELEFYANFLYGGREDTSFDEPEDDKIWASESELCIRTNKVGSIVRVYSTEGVLQHQQTILQVGETRIKLTRGIYAVTLNNGIGQMIKID